jgi:hypothetical protein
MTNKIFPVLGLLALAPLTVFAQPKAAETYKVPEAYEIYAMLLPKQWPVRVAHTRKMVIRAETDAYEMCLKPEGEFAAILGPAIANFLEVNKKSWVLEKAIPMDQPYEFVFAEELKAIFSEGIEGWKSFYQKYPDSGGYNLLSAVGFNSDKTVAVVYIAHWCGGLCGGGEFEVLQKKNDKWQTMEWKGSRCSWAS